VAAANGGSLRVEHDFVPEQATFPFGAHVAVVEVDVETGDVRLARFVAVDDCGVVVNPLLVEGQVHGGLAQGIAQALFEEATYTEDGQLTAGTFVDYLVPSAADLPGYITDRTVTPSTTNPLGVKGVGEAGTIASTPAVVNAVLDAVRHLGVRDIEMPCSPARVWQALRTAAGGSTGGSGAGGDGESGASASGPADSAASGPGGTPGGSPGGLTGQFPTGTETDEHPGGAA
jgi:carbon-monoxide dehydrogenase large subunit